MKAEGDRVACRYRLVGWPRRIPSGDLSRKVGRVTVSYILCGPKNHTLGHARGASTQGKAKEGYEAHSTVQGVPRSV